MLDEQRSYRDYLSMSSRLVIVVVLVLSLVLVGGSAASAQAGIAFVRRARVIETDDLGIAHPAGLAFLPVSNAFHVVQARGPGQPPTQYSDILMITPVEDLAGSAACWFSSPAPRS